MKTVKKYLFLFALTAALLTITFRYFLSAGIENKSAAVIISSPIVYGLAMFMAGWYWGKKEREYLPIADVGFRFHLITYIVHTLISESWFVLDLNAPFENIETIHITAAIWGVLLLLHFAIFLWTRKNAINSLNREELFE